MDEFIEMQYTQVPGSIDQAKFLAQQYFNKNGMSWKAVEYATFEDKGISCRYQDTRPENERIDEALKDNFTDDESKKFTEAVDEMVGDNEPAGQVVDGPQEFVCANCGKNYTDEKWYKKHISHCL